MGIFLENLEQMRARILPVIAARYGPFVPPPPTDPLYDDWIFIQDNTFKCDLAKDSKSPEGIKAEKNQEFREASRALKWKLKGKVEKLLPGSRNAICCRRLLKHPKAGNEVRIYRSIEFESAHYYGLQHCCSVWACPICAAKIIERRKKELTAIEAAWKKVGGNLFMLTLTFPHGPHDKLKQLLSTFSKSRQSFFNSGTWRKFKQFTGLKYWIYSLEVTHGINGWHVHLHCLLFLWGDELLKPRSGDLLRAWKKACVKWGLGEPNEHGVDIRKAKASSYIAKWGLQSEFGNATAKKGRKGHRSAWQILRDAAEGDKDSDKLFLEYAKAVKGRNQLCYSSGFKKEFPVSTDEQLEEQIEQRSVLITRISETDWYGVVLPCDIRGEILEAATTGGKPAVDDCLNFWRNLRSHTYKIPDSYPDNLNT